MPIKAGLYFSGHASQLAVALWNTGDKGMPYIVLVSWYWDSKNPDPPKELTNLLEFCNRKNRPCLINCDSNAHSVISGSTVPNARGCKLDDMATQNGLEYLNRGNTPT